MTKKLIISGDKHFKSTQPFYNAQKEFIKWFHIQDWNNENNIHIDLGDLSNNSMPDPKTSALMLEFYQGLNFKRNIIIQGNHGFNGVKKQSVLTILNELNKNIEIIDFIKKIKIENFNCLFLPYFYPSQLENKEIMNMYSFYNNLPDEFSKETYDYVFGHIENENEHFNENHFVDLSKLNIKRKILGHVHSSSSKDYLGVPVLTRYDEKLHQPKILEIDLETGKEIYYDVPRFINYVDVDYPNDLDFSQSEWYNIFSVKNCIDKESAKAYYESKYKDKELFFRGFYVKNENERDEISIDSNVKESLTIEQHFNNFFEENKIEQDLKDTCFGYWSKL